jgi:6-phosphogluconolactonase (cycloisomerase 2 family)
MHIRIAPPLQTTLLTLTVATALLCKPALAASGFVYIATNQPSGNKVVQYVRSSDGMLTRVAQVATGGKGGTGNGVGNLDPLGSQDSMVLNDTGSLLLVVNAGSNELSSMQAGGAGLKLVSKVSSGGVFPNSVALRGDLVYVLNARETPNISGFRVSSTGILSAIPGSIRSLPGGSMAAPHDLRFTPDGTRLIVSEGDTNMIDIFELNNAGVTTGVVTQASAGSGPFGSKFGRSGILLNTEANSGSLSSYNVTAQDMLAVISGAVPDTQMATCWISLTGDAKFAFVSNTASGTLSSYEIERDGTLHLLSAVAGSLSGGAPIDSSLSDDSRFIYVVDSAKGRVVFFSVQGETLNSIGSVGDLPTTVQGIAAQ